MPDFPLDVEAIVKLAARARTTIYEYEAPLRHPTPRQDLLERTPDLALVAAARMAAATGAIGLVREVRSWARISPTADIPLAHDDELLRALKVSVSEGLDPALLEPVLAELDDRGLAKIAAVLDPERESDLALLQRLAEDARADVSRAAVARLGSRYTWSWYAGIFDADPALAHADEPATLAALEQARAALGRSEAGAKPGALAALCAAAEQLSPALAVPLLEAGVLVFASAPAPGEPVEILTRLHARGGVEAVERALAAVLEAHGDPRRELQRVASWAATLPADARVELATRLLPRVEGRAPEDDSPRTPNERIQRRAVASLVLELWPKTQIPLALIEWVFDRSRRYSLALPLLEQGLNRSSAPLEHGAESLFELALARPQLLGKLSILFGRLARTVPVEQLAALTARAAASDERELKIWALEQQSGRLAPSEADEREALVQAWLADPDTRELVLRSALCRARLLPWLRRELRAGALDLSDARAVISTIGELHGGVVETDPLARRSGELEAAERRAAARAALGPWLEATPTGPPSSEEWTQLRAYTRAAFDSDKPMFISLDVLPVGPWTPADLELLDALEAAAMPGQPSSSVMRHQLVSVLENYPPADAAARAKRVHDAWRAHLDAQPPTDDPYRGLDERELGRLQQLSAGLVETPEAPAADWMDEEDNDDDDEERQS